MGCLKCGRATEQNQVFCPDCLKVMQANPVKPDTPVHLYRREVAEKKAIQKRQVKPEEQIQQLQKINRRLTIAVVALAIVFVSVTSALGFLLYRSATSPAIGQNYNTVNTSSTGTTAGK